MLTIILLIKTINNTTTIITNTTNNNSIDTDYTLTVVSLFTLNYLTQSVEIKMKSFFFCSSEDLIYRLKTLQFFSYYIYFNTKY